MITVNLDGLVDFERMVKAFPETTRKAAALAINQTADREALSRVQRDMMKQVNFKLSYLRSRDKTGVGKRATPYTLEATVYARDRPTMLNRFRPNPNLLPKRAKKGRGTGVKVRVKPSSTKTMKGAFVQKLGTDGKNIGVFVRTAGGAAEPPSGVSHGGGRYIKAYRAWLLYAPSIDQVMHDTAARNADKIQSYLHREFLRQFNRLNK